MRPARGAFYGGALTALDIGRRAHCALDALVWGAPWIASSWMRLGLLLGLLCAGAGLGGIKPGAFFGNVVVSPNGKERFLTLSGLELSLTLLGPLLCEQCLE